MLLTSELKLKIYFMAFENYTQLKKQILNLYKLMTSEYFTKKIAYDGCRYLIRKGSKCKLVKLSAQ